MKLESVLIKGRNTRWGGVKRVCRWLIRHYYTCDIPLEANISETVRFPHAGLYVVISAYATVGDNVVIQHGVLLGASKGIENAPTIGANTILGAKCSVIGNVTVGENCIIGAGAIVTKDVPPNTTVVGINQMRPNSEDMKKALAYFDNSNKT